MANPQKLYDVYISYPPGVDTKQIDNCIKNNLSPEEAGEIIHALEENRQAIIAERCTNEERLNAQHYFSYLGLDVIIRLSLELMPDQEVDPEFAKLSAVIPQCPVCHTIFEDPETEECPTCHLYLKTATEALIYRKRIEWQERMAFEHRKQHEIAYKLLKEKQIEEKRLRQKIREELETELLQELGILNTWQAKLYNKRFVIIAILIVLAIFALIVVGFLIAHSMLQK